MNLNFVFLQWNQDKLRTISLYDFKLETNCGSFLRVRIQPSDFTIQSECSMRFLGMDKFKKKLHQHQISIKHGQFPVSVSPLRCAIETKAPLRVQSLLTLVGEGGKNKKLWHY